jgi:hypothetical protein
MKLQKTKRGSSTSSSRDLLSTHDAGDRMVLAVRVPFMNFILRGSVVLFLMGCFSCGPNLNPSVADCKAFREKLKKLPPSKKVPGLASSIFFPLGKDFLVAEKDSSTSFDRVNSSGNKIGHVNLEARSVDFVRGLVSGGGASLGFVDATKKLEVIDSEFNLHSYPPPLLQDTKTVALYGKQYSMNRAVDVVTFPGEIVEFSVTADPEVLGFGSLGRNGESVCVAERVKDGSRIHCKGPSGGYFLNGVPKTLGLPIFSMTPTHLFFREATTIFFAPLSSGGSVSEFKAADVKKVSMGASTYCGQMIYDSDQSSLKAFFWSDGELVPLNVPSNSPYDIAVNQYSLSYNAGADVMTHEF